MICQILTGRHGITWKCTKIQNVKAVKLSTTLLIIGFRNYRENCIKNIDNRFFFSWFDGFEILLFIINSIHIYIIGSTLSKFVNYSLSWNFFLTNICCIMVINILFIINFPCKNIKLIPIEHSIQIMFITIILCHQFMI